MAISTSDAAARARSEQARHAIQTRWAGVTDPTERKAATRAATIASAVKTVSTRWAELSDDQRRAVVRAQVVASRRAQGLSDHVSDERVLIQLAREVLGGGHDG